MLNQVMTATRGATDAFSGVGRHVNNSVCLFVKLSSQFTYYCDFIPYLIFVFSLGPYCFLL